MNLIITYIDNITGLDIVIIIFGAILIICQIISLFLDRLEKADNGKKKLLKSCESLMELLPLLGLLGTVIALLSTLKAFNPEEGQKSLIIIQEFAPALTTTISGISMLILNLIVYVIVTTCISVKED